MADRAEPARVRVLHASQPTDGGVAVYVVQAAADQVRRGWEVAVACPPDGDLAARLLAAGVAHVPWHAGRAPGPGTVREALDLRRIVRRFAPDVLHLHSAKAGLAGRLPLGPLGGPAVPTIFQPHGWSWLAATGAQAAAGLLWERLAARRTGALVCVGTGELLQGREARVRAPYRLVRNGVDLGHFTPAGPAERRAARAALGLPADAPLAVCIGRVTRQKGQDVLLAAWPAVRRRCPRALLAVVGDGDALPRLRRAAPPGVRFVPPVADTRGWLAAADVVVLPSRWEGLALVALEALARGRSLVCSNVPGLAEVVQPESGALVPPDDPGGLAEAVAYRLERPREADAEGRAGAGAAGEFDLSGTLALLSAVTSGLAGAGRAGGAAAGGAGSAGGAGTAEKPSAGGRAGGVPVTEPGGGTGAGGTGGEAGGDACAETGGEAGGDAGGTGTGGAGTGVPAPFPPNSSR
ncbi:glycosyltransferase [Actinomadura sp. 21ATH]|uniref:glycosyltransferase n=1 Tax=Actinomadura sp. 21ATH TaxID=1735444 RepID=UPI0035C04AA2